MGAAVAVVRELGLRVGEPVVLSEAWNVLVHLRPSPVVARVTTRGARIGSGDAARELAVARHAVACGAPVIPPTDLVDPGPHEHEGHTVVLWRYVHVDGELDPAAAGRRLRELHDALASFDGVLPRAGYADRVAEMLHDNSSRDADLLRALAATDLPAGQALHGDAHLFNCIQSAAGPVWHDLETACSGPREYDLAALVFRHRMHGDHPAGEAALAAYGEVDRELLDVAFSVYSAWIAASVMNALPRRPSLAADLIRQLAYLRRHHS